MHLAYTPVLELCMHHPACPCYIRRQENDLWLAGHVRLLNAVLSIPHPATRVMLPPLAEQRALFVTGKESRRHQSRGRERGSAADLGGHQVSRRRHDRAAADRGCQGHRGHAGQERQHHLLAQRRQHAHGRELRHGSSIENVLRSLLTALGNRVYLAPGLEMHGGLQIHLVAN